MFEGYGGTQDDIEAEKIRRLKEEVQNKADEVLRHLPKYSINEAMFRSQLVKTDNKASLELVMQYLDTYISQFKYYKKLVKMEMKNKRRLQSGN